MSKLNVFIKDTFLKITKSISFISMLLSPLIIIAIIVGIGYFASQTFDGMSEIELAVLSDEPEIATVIEETEESITIAEGIETEAEAREELANEAIDGYLVLDWENDQLNASITHSDSLENHLPIIEQALTSTQNVNPSSRNRRFARTNSKPQ